MLSGTTAAVTPAEAVAEVAGSRPDSPSTGQMGADAIAGGAADGHTDNRLQSESKSVNGMLYGATLADVLAAAPATGTAGVKRKSVPESATDIESPSKRQDAN